MSAPPKVPVLGVGISATNYDQVATACRTWIAQPDAAAARYICLVSVHGIVTAVKDRRFLAVLNRADIATPDGMPVVWALKSFGIAQQTRVYGPDLMLFLCAQAEKLGHRIFLYGAVDATLEKLRQNLLRSFPKLTIAGSWAPPFRRLTPEEDEAALRMILDSRADLVFIGMSTPKQDIWMCEHRERLAGRVLLGVGAAFDFHAGMVRQAPRWMQRHGLEWLFRLMVEPRRLWRRYLLETPLFLPLWAMQRMGLRRFEPVHYEPLRENINGTKS